MADLKELAENLSMAAHEVLGNLYDAGQGTDEDGNDFEDVKNLQDAADQLDRYLSDMKEGRSHENL